MAQTRTVGGDDGFGGEVEGDAQNVGIFDGKHAVLVVVVVLTAQTATDDLLAKKLGAERANAEDVRNGVGIPALGEHGNGDDAANGFAELAFLANGVHHLAEKIGIGDFAGLLDIAAFDHFAAEALDFVGGHFAEIFVERFARFELFAINQQSAGSGVAVAGLVVVAKQFQTAGMMHGGLAVFADAVKAGDVIIDKLGRGSVVANDDEHRWDADVLLLPKRVGLLIVTVERVECGLQLDRQAQRVKVAGFAASFLGHLFADVFP